MNRSYKQSHDVIAVDTARTLDGLFRERVRRSPEKCAYRYYDPTTESWRDMSWASMEEHILHWRAALAAESLNPGDRVAIMMRNCCEWVMFEQAALSLGLVVVPLYPNDRADNAAFIINDAAVKLLLIETREQWTVLNAALAGCESLLRVVMLEPMPEPPAPNDKQGLIEASSWLPDSVMHYKHDNAADDLATIVYTSGTTGHPKGVMLSHHNILWNAWAGMQHISVYTEDLFLSFLPLSHTFERTVGYYIPMMAGTTVAYARSISELAEDLISIRPTILISVPRIFERIYAKLNTQLDEKPALAKKLFELTVDIGWQRFQFKQHRANWHPALLAWPLLNQLVASKVTNKLGGRLRFAICGGAPLPEKIARIFIGLGVQIEQGYGLTETSPVLSVNKLDDNDPGSVGTPLVDVELKLAENHELLVRSPGIMLGYWNNPEATLEIIDDKGWLHSGDKVELHNGHLYITGRLKEILVLANGEKVPPVDMEAALVDDNLIDQAVVVGEGRPYLVALLVLNKDQWRRFASRLVTNTESDESLHDERLQQLLLERIGKDLHEFPGYAQIRRVLLSLQDWNIDNGMMTPTLKLRRNRILEYHAADIEQLYEGH
ncbi:AMP-dependent synthetase/ligase [Sulfuriflexus mobilis]|uniref:AMP-dependent synthetase/ligase n=1 Tax=Sulfuriflexus mobilis TaxID=1811807 RepID=UPI000F822BD4|nr:long-chain fatty acid--CoA ligase [Sulfuriflexus mobilis]